MKAIILAAGYATRMYPLTENQPKALLPLRGKPVIDYIVEQIRRIPEVTEIFVVTNSKFYPHFCEWAAGANMEAQKASAESARQVSLEASEQAISPALRVEVLDDGTDSNENRRGAVGDVFFTIQQKNIDDELLIIASDNYFTYDLREQLAVFRKTGCDTLVAKEMHDREKIKAFGVAVLAPDGKLLDFEEKPQNPKSNTAVYAAYFYRRETTPLFEKYLAEGHSPDNIGAFPQWLYKTHPVYVYIMNGDCHDIGTIEMYNEMNK